VLLGFFHPKVYHMWMSHKYILSMQVKEGCLVTGRPAAAGEALVALAAAAFQPSCGFTAAHHRRPGRRCAASALPSASKLQTEEEGGNAG
jgi:hypothetical protein